MSISVRLRDDFQLVHEPIASDDAGILREEAEVAQKLRERLTHSTGGTFLITGFRGVGKTTAVRQALRQLSRGDHQRVVDVTVPVARPASSTALLFEVTRRLVERLSETGVLRSLSPQVRDPLLTAYARTSLAYSQTSTKSDERSSSMGIGGSASFGKAKLPLPRFSSTRTRAESRATEISFLAYSEADVEHDFLRIVELLGRGDAVRGSRRARLLSRVGIGSPTKALEAQIVVVFDEIDKLTEADGGLEAFEIMLGGLKNLLAASGAHFVVVAGVDLHDEWLRESATANSLYRSVFAWQGYVGCGWEAAGRLLDDALLEGSPADREILAGYLQYRGRGVIRNVLYEFNELIEWDDDGPFIEISGTAEDRVKLLGELSSVLQRGFDGVEDAVLSAPSDKDRFKQVAYFTADWVLRSGKEAFNVEDVMDPARGTPLDLVLQPSSEIIHTALAALAANAYLEVSLRDSELATQGPDAERHREQYSLSRDLLERLALIARSSPRARAEFGREDQLTGPLEGGGDAQRSAQSVVGDRYQILERIGQGGFGTVWKAIDTLDGAVVAVKIVRTSTPSARDRVRTEGELLRQASGPGLVPVVDFFFEDDRAIIVTGRVEGESLAGLKALPAPLAVRIAVQMLETVESLHSQRIIHADIKPSNIILMDDSRPVLVDLGTATRESSASAYREPSRDSSTVTGLTGTPAYMAPELFLGARPSQASDIWAVGILLLELITGEVPNPRTRAALVVTTDSQAISPPLKAAILRALDDDPVMRPSAVDMRRELSQTPEGHGLPGSQD